MAPINIVKCPQCGSYLLAAQKQKTKLCPYCSARINLQRAQHIAAAPNAAAASEVLRRLKAEKGFTHT
jgi:DNA-directed RNA polymerase subunit RPC12/RpoP